MRFIFAEILPHNPKNHLTIPRLIVLRSNLKSNLDKFVNLGFKFSRRDPHLENAKFSPNYSDALLAEKALSTSHV